MKKTIQFPQRRIFPLKGNLVGHSVFPLEEFKALVKYERARSDRNGSIFSIAVFNLDNDSRIDPYNMVFLVSQFSRSIDCMGVGEEGQIAVLLPDTVRQGATIFGEKLLGELDRMDRDSVHFNVYSYPENWLFSEKSPPSSGIGNEPKKNSPTDKIELLFIDRIPTWKRVLDITGASLILLMASPIFLVLSCYIKVVSPGPIFFKQTRIGYKGVPFDFWKFRTMKCENNQRFHGDHAKSFILDGDIPMEKLDDRDPRIFFGGRVIRKSCLDELPQLWNVLKGEMSLVGPRPCIPYEAEEYLRWHTHRFDVLPGLSGLWQVSGKNKLTFKQMVRLDIAYCKNITLLGDLAIILRTPLAIMKMIFEAFAKKILAAIARPDQAIERKEKYASRSTALNDSSLLASKSGSIANRSFPQ